jgi:hypothetical protein
VDDFAASLDETRMHPHCLAVPWMPGIADFTNIPNMGVVLLSSITGSAIIKGWRTNSSAQKRAISVAKERSSGGSAWAAC